MQRISALVVRSACVMEPIVAAVALVRSARAMQRIVALVVLVRSTFALLVRSTRAMLVRSARAMQRIAALVALVLAACASAPATTSSARAEPLPALDLTLLDGGAWSVASARGKPLVIDVWASWCVPCGKGFPKLNALAARRPDVTVVAVTLDEDIAAARAFIAKHPLTVTVALDVDHVLTRAPLQIAQLPTLLIVDASGVIRHRIVEPREADYDGIDALLAAI